MASAIDRKPYHSNSGLAESYTLNGADESYPQGKPPAGNFNVNASPSAVRQPRAAAHDGHDSTGADADDRIYLHIETVPENSAASMEQRSSRHRARCRCHEQTKSNQSPERVIKHDAFITPQPRILNQRASSANRIGQSTPMSKCEAVQIVDLQVSAMGHDATKEQGTSESLVPISRPGSAQAPPRRKKHHVVVISREKSESATQRSKHVLSSQSLTDLVNRYPDPRRQQRSGQAQQDTGERDTLTIQNFPPTAAGDKPAAPHQALSTIHSVQGDEEPAQVHVKAKATKQVRINSAVQIYDDLDTEDSQPNRLSHVGGAHTERNSRGQLMNITRLRQDYGYKARTAERVRAPGMSIPDNVPQGSVVRIQHTSKGKIKVITGSEGNFTTTILEGNRKPPGGIRPSTRLDLMEDVLVITRKTSTSKDALVTRPGSGRAIQAGMTSQPAAIRNGEAKQKSADSSPQRRAETNRHAHQPHAYAFRDRIVAKPQQQQTKETQPAQKTVERNSPYVNIADGKGEAMQRSDTGVSLNYQKAPSSPMMSARQQRWKQKDSLPERKPESSTDQSQKKAERKLGKHRQYAQSRYRVQTDTSDNKSSRHVTFQYDSHKPPPAREAPTVEEDYASPSRHKWELEYDDYVPPTKEEPKKQEEQVETPNPTKETTKETTSDQNTDFHITDAQALAEKQYWEARHQYVKQWREQHQGVPRERKPSPEKTTTTHTVVMQADPKQNNTAESSHLPPKQQLWSKETLLQSGPNNMIKTTTTTGSPGYGNSYALPTPPRSPSRSRSRRRSASRSRRPNTPNTNLVADQLQDDDEKGLASRRARLQATSTELFEDSMYENFAHSKFKSKSRPTSSSKAKPQVVDRETMVKLLHMTMPKKQQEPEQF